MKTALRLAGLVAAGALTIGIAFAGNMSARFGNTVVATSPDGTVTKFYYDADGKVSAKAEAGGKVVLESTGTWRQDGDKVCLTLDPTFGPFEAGKERCVPLMGDKVGDSWTTPGKDTSGNPITIEVKIVAGR